MTTDQDEETLAEWLFYIRKSQRRRRITHGTLSTTQNTDQEEHE